MKRLWCLTLLWLVAAPRPAAGQSDPDRRWRWGGTGETVFEHTRAAMRDPHFGMRLYPARAVPGTLGRLGDPHAPDADDRAVAKDRSHIFWDVAFGERAPVVGFYDVHPTRSVRHTRGFQLNLDAAAFLLLDFSAQSSAVINTDYRIGLSGDLRPWADGWDALSLSLGFFHQSTHLGDEYVLSARTIQGGEEPVVNPYLPYRANPSYEAFPLTVSYDLEPAATPALTARLYGGGTLYVDSEVHEATRPDLRLGLEVRLAPVATPATLATEPGPESSMGQFVRSARRYGLGTNEATPAPPPPRRQRWRSGHAFMFAYEVLAQRRFRHADGVGRRATFELEGGHWLSHHAMAIWFINLNTLRSSSNAFAVALELIAGRSQHGQLTEYTALTTGGISFSYYW